MVVTKINKPGTTNVISPTLLAGVYNYNSGLNAGEIVPLQVDADGKLYLSSTIVSIPSTTVNASTYTVLPTDDTLFINYTLTGVCDITIPSSLIATDGWKISIKDSGNNALTNNINIITEGTEEIEFTTSNLVISGNGDSITLKSDSNNLFII